MRLCVQLRQAASQVHSSWRLQRHHILKSCATQSISKTSISNGIHTIDLKRICSTSRTQSSERSATNHEGTKLDQGSESQQHPNLLLENDEHYMRMALEQAQLAYAEAEVPIGAVIISSNGDVLAAAHNITEQHSDPTAHAEMLCIRQAATSAKGWRLLESTMYVTLEPCVMCAGALLQARVGRVVYGAKNNLLGADGSWIDVMRPPSPGTCCSTREGDSDSDPDSQESKEESKKITGEGKIQPRRPHPFHPDMKVTTGVLEKECSALMKEFFKERRRSGGYRTSIEDTVTKK